MNIGQYVEKYRLARKGDGQVVLLEGIHAFKHALRFGAEFLEILYVKDSQLENFQDNVLKDSEREFILKNGIEVEQDFFEKLLPYRVRSKVIALAKKPQ
jgi:tRNA G18 (ribose-2'-O)-methylase SpoU